jgi:hypothetical protein
VSGRKGAADLEAIREARPYLRSAIALLIYLRFGAEPLPQIYETADQFLDQLEKDVEAVKTQS